MAAAALQSQLNKQQSNFGPTLLPARAQTNSHTSIIATAQIPDYTVLRWTFGRGSVFWKIWPAVLLHTVFAAGVVTLTMETEIDLAIPNILLTVLGVVIGFVISYRASSGYDRYWMGRTCWSEIIRNSRAMGRLVWFHVPLRLVPKGQQNSTDTGSGEGTGTEKEKAIKKVMQEKHQALDLIAGFSVALKHHLRGELGIYYEDLYHLVKPLHDPSPHTSKPTRTQSPPPVGNSTSVLTHQTIIDFEDPVIPPLNSYGTFLSYGSSQRPHFRRRGSDVSSHSDCSHSKVPLLPSSLPGEGGICSRISPEMIPFSSFFGAARDAVRKNWARRKQPLEVLPPGIIIEESSGQRKWAGPTFSKKVARGKHRPKVAGNGQNLPLEILRCLSDWCSILEDRGTVPGTSLGSMMGCISAFEDNLSTLERILTTPLPFVYSVHIRHTVWLYLFFLPFQLISQFGWYTIPGVCIASFIYLGFLAAGEEIEQPFGYDENDLDLDLFCHEIIHADIDHLKSSPCLNAVVHENGRGFGREEGGMRRRQSTTLVEVGQVDVVKPGDGGVLVEGI